MTITFDLVFFLLALAAVLFLLGTGVIQKWARNWLVPLGLACVAVAMLVEWKT